LLQLGYADVPFDCPKDSKSSSLRLRKKLFDLCHAQLCYQVPLYSTGTGALKNPHKQAGNKEKTLHQKKKHDTHTSPQVVFHFLLQILHYYSNYNYSQHWRLKGKFRFR
jgi:hypothetical protein